MSNLDYRYERVANELMRNLLRQYGETDWTMDQLYDVVKRVGGLDASKYTLTKYGPDTLTPSEQTVVIKVV